MNTRQLILILMILIPGVVLSEETMTTEDLPNFDVLWDYSDPAATEMKFRELLPAAATSGNSSYHAQLLTQIARTQGLQRQFDQAHATLAEANKLIHDTDTVARIRYLLERGRVYNSSGVFDKAKQNFLQAWALSSAKDKDYWAIDAAHMMGIVEPPEKQLDWSLKALEITEKTDDMRAKGWLGSLYNNIGWTYHDMDQFDTALTYFKKGLQWREKIEDEPGARIARWTVARAYRSLERLDEALEIQLSLEKEFNSDDVARDGYVYEELGELYLLMEDKEKSSHYFKLAYDLLSEDPWLQANQPDRLSRLKALSQ